MTIYSAHYRDQLQSLLADQNALKLKTTVTMVFSINAGKQPTSKGPKNKNNSSKTASCARRQHDVMVCGITDER